MKNPGNKTTVLAVAIATAIIVVSLYLLLSDQVNLFNRDRRQTTRTSQDNEEKINLDATTEEEKNAGEARKEELIRRDSPESQSSNVVYPVISTWSQNANDDLEVSGFVPGIVEDGGKCTLMLEKDGRKIIAERTAKSDAQSTICGVMNIAAGELSGGRWNAVLFYESATYKGQSNTTVMELN